MVNTQPTLPDFDDPPVVETVLGVEFERLANWNIPHFGAFWHEVKSEYPLFEVQPPLASQIERFGKGLKLPPTFRVEVNTQVPARCWFIHKTETRLLQVQNNRFIHNWRKVAGKEPYPRYENIRPIFESEWVRFCKFLESNAIEKPDVRQCEVTYVNHIDQGRGWQTFADLRDVLPCWSGAMSEEFLPSPEAIVLSVQYVMPNDQGRLHIQFQPAIRHADAKEILQLTLTARGRPDSSSTSDILKWLDLGREWVVRGFSDFTSNKMHDLWRRKTRP